MAGAAAPSILAATACRCLSCQAAATSTAGLALVTCTWRPQLQPQSDQARLVLTRMHHGSWCTLAQSPAPQHSSCAASAHDAQCHHQRWLAVAHPSCKKIHSQYKQLSSYPCKRDQPATGWYWPLHCSTAEGDEWSVSLPCALLDCT